MPQQTRLFQLLIFNFVPFEIFVVNKFCRARNVRWEWVFLRVFRDLRGDLMLLPASASLRKLLPG